MFWYSINQFKKHGQVYEIVTYKIFVTLNPSRKQKILIFFTVADCGTTGRIITQTRDKLFNYSDELFKNLAELFKL